MTDARLPSRWLTDPHLDALTDRAWRVHTSALMWSAEQGTDGLIPRRTLRLLHPEGASTPDADGLVDAGLWSTEGADYRVLDWARTQSLAAVVEHQRERNRRKQQAHRDRARERDGVTGYVTGESPRRGEERRGEARPGEAQTSLNAGTTRERTRESPPRRESPDERMRRLMATADALESAASSPAPITEWPVREVPA